MGSAATLGSSGRGQAEVGTVTVVMGAFIVTVLARGVEDQDVQHQFQLPLKKQCYNIKLSCHGKQN